MRTATEQDRDSVSAVTPPPSGGDVGRGGNSSWRRIRLRNWRVSLRLVALIVIPTLTAGFLISLRVSSELANASVYQRIEQLATLGDKVSELTYRLEAERNDAAMYIATSHKESSKLELTEARAAVDSVGQKVEAEARKIDDSYPRLVRDRVRDVLNRLDKIPALRKGTTQTRMSADATIDRYTEFITDLVNLDDLIAQGSSNDELAERARALAALARAKASSSRERAYLAVALAEGRFLPNALEEFRAARAQRDSELAAFRTAATADEAQYYSDTVTGPQVDRAEFTRQQAVSLATKSPKLSLRGVKADAQQWSRDMEVRLVRMREVEDRLVGGLMDQSRELNDEAERSALIVGGLLLLVLIIVIGATIIVAQSLVRPLRRLRAGALDVAGNRLPGLVRRLRDADASQTSFTIEPIEVSSTDEIGEVARAFDEVHREAVRLASNEAMLRGNVNAMFVNLSRRSQSLIERQLRLIDDLEQGEQDSDRLESMFKLDHLATRMRRNCENLLVLGGQDQARRWNQPVPLVDVVRASLSEVEQYERITLRIQGEVSVVGNVVSDLVHLTAELVENATVFSPEHAKVAVSGHLLSGGGAMLQISDNGVGMSAEELEEANWRLANPPVVDVSVSRRMGLFVVGRLAQRHGIRVELRAALSGGLTAFVLLPHAVIMQGTTVPAQSAPGLEPAATGAQQQITGAQPSVGAMPELDQPVGASLSAFGMEEAVEPPRSSPLPRRRSAASPDEPSVPYGAPTGEREPQYGPPSPMGEPMPYAAPAASAPPPPPPPSAPSPQPGDGVTGPIRVPQPEGTTGPVQVPPVAGATGPIPTAPPQTGPIPTAASPTGPPSGGRPPSPSARGGPVAGGHSPIYDAIQSEWFQRSRGVPSGTPPGGAPQSPMWNSPGDEGWRAAEAVRAPAANGQTQSGLPKRVPGNNRVPGTASAGPVEAPTQAPQAETVRNRFANFQQGVRRGRAATHINDERETE